jgi:hypothetical protein
MGGVASFGTTNQVQAYNPGTNTWTTVTSMPTPRSALAAVTGVDGRIYAIGGLDINGKPVAVVEAYTVATNTWSTVRSLLSPRSGLAAAVGGDGKIYAIGGLDANNTQLTNVDAYSVATNAWVTTGNNLPAGRSGLAAATGADGRMYAIGGRDSTGPLTAVTALAVAPDPRNQAFVAQAYLDLLHRPANDTGATAFVVALNLSLLSTEEVALTIESGVEYRTGQINAIYQTLLHRPVDAGGLNGFLSFLAGGGTYEQIQATIAGSTEFFALSGSTNDGFLNALYQDALGRAPDPAGRASFNQFLGQGGTRTQVASTIFTSPEYYTRLVGGWYVTFLRRPADPGGLGGFVTALLQGARDEDLIASLVGSDEYFARL